MKRPFAIRHDQEITWIREWFKAQVLNDRSAVDLRRLPLVKSREDALRLIDCELDEHERVRLQKALSARRRRSTADKKAVVTELDREARDILLAVAANRNLTTSALIKETFGKAFEQLDR